MPRDSKPVEVSTPAAAPERESDVLRRGIKLISDRLPKSWRVDVAEQVQVGQGSRRADAIVDLTAPDGSRALLVFEAKRSIVVRDLPAVVSHLQAVISELDSGEAAVVPVVAGRYLAPSVRKWLQEHRVSFVDATGNLHVVLERPALYLRDAGSDHDPLARPGSTPLYPTRTSRCPSRARVGRLLATGHRHQARPAIPSLDRRHVQGCGVSGT
jgi:hypothetical protein